MRLHLARNFRKSNLGGMLVDGTPLATCRMYEDAASVWSGFSKNATEGMARPFALPIWTVLLVGGQLLPPICLLLGLATSYFDAAEIAIFGVAWHVLGFCPRR